MVPKANMAGPKQPDPVRIPSPDDPDIIEARRKKLMADFADRDGRAKTQLADGGSSGAGAYTRTALG